MDPDYCQDAFPVYVMGGSAAIVSLFFLILSQKKSYKQNSSVYYHGFGLFLIISVALCGRQFYLGRQNVVEDIYRDISKHAKEIGKQEKTHLSALFSQAMHGDVTPKSLSEQVLGWSKTLAGFGNTQQARMNEWSTMKGMTKQNATTMLRDRACRIVGQINKHRKT